MSEPRSPRTTTNRRRTFGPLVAWCAVSTALGCSAQIEDPNAANAGSSNPGAGSTSAGSSGNAGTSGNAGSSNNAGGTSNGTSGGSAGVPGGGVAGSAGGPTAPPLDAAAQACAASNGALNAGITRLRRLTRDQFNNTVRDLLGATGTPADALAPDERMGPFASNAIAPVTELLVTQHQEVAAKLAKDAVARMSQVSPCDLNSDTGTSTTCATRFVNDFGQRAFRRPLLAEETKDYLAVYGIGKQGGGAANGFRLVVETLLQSPFFLYHHDVGATAKPQANTVGITPYELAARLSYFLWNSMPDATLFAAAADGSLAQDATVNTQVERMLADAKAGSTIALFHRQWLRLDDLATRDKDAEAFPLYDASLVDAMQQETAFFTNQVILKGDGLLKTLLTSNVAYPQGNLFNVYGVAQPSGFKAGSPVTLDASQRAGLLTQAAFLSRNAHRDQSSPVHRGIVVRENLLCQAIPAPPNNANTSPPPPTPATTTRERFAQHTADATCAGCHTLMDPIGLGFEHYDAVGAYRDQDGGSAVDATGQILIARSDVTGPFDGAVELANKLANSSEVADCVASQWFRFSLGRIESTDDACSMVSIRDGFKASGGNVRSLLAKIATSAAFRNVRATGK